MRILTAELPPRIILSRKGSDSAYGGRSSLRIESELISLPIPENSKAFPADKCMPNHTRYVDLPEHELIGAFSEHLPSLSPESFVHLDPDIRPELRSKGVNCSALLFGQVGAAQSHLENQGVGAGSLFLFFGWFQSAEFIDKRWKRRGPNQHIIWGWFQVKDSFQVTSKENAESLSWAKHHPHVSHWQRYGANNRLYVARRRLSFAPHICGAGVFNWIPDLNLTQICHEGATRTRWCVPDFFLRTGLSYNNVTDTRCPNAKDRIHFKSAAIGQEFVFPKGRDLHLNERAKVAAWLAKLFEGATA